MGLLLMYLIYCNAVIVLTFPTIKEKRLLVFLA